MNTNKTVRLWLDDERDPTNGIIQQEFGAKGDEVWVKTVDAAKQYILSYNVVSISFDHDLGNLEETGYDLAKWIEERSFKGHMKRIEWFVHSMSIVGRKNIIEAMKKSETFWRQHNE